MLRLVTLSHYTVTFIVTLYLIILFVEKGSSSDKKEGWKSKYSIKVQFQIRGARGNPTERANDPNQLIDNSVSLCSKILVSHSSIGGVTHLSAIFGLQCAHITLQQIEKLFVKIFRISNFKFDY